MKKLILPAFCLALCLTSVSASAVTVSNAVVVMLNDDRQVIKSEELPEPVRKTLSGDEYKGWAVKEAAIVKHNEDKAAATHYEVILTKEQETKTLKFNQDGTLVK